MDRSTNERANGFLAPYRVLDLSDDRGLIAGSMFARLGADVIQVEPPAGSSARRAPPFAQDAPAGENSLFWSAYAAGKRGISCALDKPEGRSLLHRLVANADVLIETEGAAIHPELRHELLCSINARLIHVTITGFGSDGPKARYAESDLIVWSAAGVLWLNQDLHGKPLRYSVPQAYLHAGADAASGALMALLARHRTGRGQHVDVSAQQSAAATALASGLAAAVGHQGFMLYPSPRRQDEDDEARAEPARPGKWRVKDGIVELHIGLGSGTGRFDNRFFEWMRRVGAVPAGVAEWDWQELPALVESGQVSMEQYEEARAAVAACLARYTKREIMEIVVSEKLLMAPSLTIAEMREDTHLNHRGLFEVLQEDGHPRTLPGRLGLTSIASHAQRGPAPRIGEHNAQVYGGLLGLSAEELARLKSKGVI
jgi:crotonobetainyl-CoA:carnitine CoA-transferase CaiB-like acyl-CoA transferase